MKAARLFLRWLAAAAMLASCSDGSTRSPASEVPTQPTKLAVRKNPEAVVRAFLAWYTQSHGGGGVVPASVDGDTADIYRVDFDEAEQYLAVFRASGFVSEEYLAGERSLMQQADSVMQANPQTDGPPPGFDYDHVVCSQDAESDLALLARTKPVVTIKADSAQVFFPQLPNEPREGSELSFQLTLHGGKWLIRPLSCINLHQITDNQI